MKSRIRTMLAAGLVTAFALPVLAGCGGGDTTTPAAATPAGAISGAQSSGAPAGQADAGGSKLKQSIEMRRKEEDMIAACMKTSGFSYQPYVPGDVLHPLPEGPTDYDGLKTYRGKYGFGHLFGAIVYKDDPNVVDMFHDVNPNEAAKDKLDAGQKKAYEVAMYGREVSGTKRADSLAPSEGCVGAAVKAVDPAARKEREERSKAILENRIDDYCPPSCQSWKAGEAQLKALEAAYANCLKGKGYTAVPNNGVADGVSVYDIAGKTVQKRFDEVNKTKAMGTPNIDPDVARAELTKEIKVALEDLECGKDYHVTMNKLQKQTMDLRPATGGLS